MKCGFLSSVLDASFSCISHVILSKLDPRGRLGEKAGNACACEEFEDRGWYIGLKLSRVLVLAHPCVVC